MVARESLSESELGFTPVTPANPALINVKSIAAASCRDAAGTLHRLELALISPFHTARILHSIQQNYQRQHYFAFVAVQSLGSYTHINMNQRVSLSDLPPQIPASILTPSSNSTFARFTSVHPIVEGTITTQSP